VKRGGEGKGRGGEALGPAPLHIISGYATVGGGALTTVSLGPSVDSWQ